MKTTVVAIIAMVLMAFLVMPVMAANADNGLYGNKYVATPFVAAKTGMMQGQLRAGEPGLTAGVNVTELATGVVNPLAIRPDGTFEFIGAPGRYVINIADGNGGQPEQAYFNIVAGMTTKIESELLGHAVGTVGKKVQIKSATYGATKVVIDQQFVPAVPGVPAVIETQLVMTNPGVPGTPGTWTYDYPAGHVHAKTVGGHSSHDFMYRGDKYQIVQNNEHYQAFVKIGGAYVPAMKIWTYTPGTDEIPPTYEYVDVVITPAIPAVPAIPEVSHIEGSYVDVTAEVQQVVDMRIHTFTFNNAMNPGGIVVDGTVVVVIADPAVNIVKNVHIVYDGGVVDAAEYETITL